VEHGERPEGCDALQAGHTQEPSGRLQQVECSVADPDPYVFGPPGSGSGSSSQRRGSGSGTGSLHHQAKKSKKNLLFCYFFLTFYL
jgi:hypothetical protein